MAFYDSRWAVTVIELLQHEIDRLKDENRLQQSMLDDTRGLDEDRMKDLSKVKGELYDLKVLVDELHLKLSEVENDRDEWRAIAASAAALPKE